VNRVGAFADSAQSHHALVAPRAARPEINYQFIHNSLRPGISRPLRRKLSGIFKEIRIEALGLGKF
jgi:hypothetical protein